MRQGVTVAVPAGRERLFVSYAGRDRSWAEWVAWQLTEAGYLVELDTWDWSAGDNAVLRMSDALERADRVVALYSRAYFERPRFSTDEWTAVQARPDRQGRLVPLRLEDPPVPLNRLFMTYSTLSAVAFLRR